MYWKFTHDFTVNLILYILLHFTELLLLNRISHFVIGRNTYAAWKLGKHENLKNCKLKNLLLRLGNSKIGLLFT